MSWSLCSSVKEKIRVSDETCSLLERMALVHALDCRKMGRGSMESEEIEPDARAVRETSSRVPMW